MMLNLTSSLKMYNVVIPNSHANNHLATYLVNCSGNVTFFDLCDVKELAETHGLDLHTKIKRQDTYKLHEFKNEIESVLDKLNTWEQPPKKYLIDAPMSWGFAREMFLGSHMFVSSFSGKVYLDMINDMQEDFDLSPVNELIDHKKFDDKINRYLPDDNIVYFNGHDNITDIAIALKEYRNIDWTVEQVRECILEQPFWVLSKAFRDLDTNIMVILTELYTSMMDNLVNSTVSYVPKVKDKLNKFKNIVNVHYFDMYMFYCQSEQEAHVLYNMFCLGMGIEPMPDVLNSIRKELLYNRVTAFGSIPLPEQYQDTIESIANVLLNVHDIKSDTDLQDIGWNDNCQLALKIAFPNLDINYKQCYTVSDIIKD